LPATLDVKFIKIFIWETHMPRFFKETPAVVKPLLSDFYIACRNKRWQVAEEKLEELRRINPECDLNYAEFLRPGWFTLTPEELIVDFLYDSDTSALKFFLDHKVDTIDYQWVVMAALYHNNFKLISIDFLNILKRSRPDLEPMLVAERHKAREMRSERMLEILVTHINPRNFIVLQKFLPTIDNPSAIKRALDIFVVYGYDGSYRFNYNSLKPADDSVTMDVLPLILEKMKRSLEAKLDQLQLQQTIRPPECNNPTPNI
jgi:hypothetical protein